MIVSIARFVRRRERFTYLGAGVLIGAVAASALAGWARPTVEPIAPAPEQGRAADGVPARALSVVDGDTFEARVSAFPGQEIVARIRIAGLDTPERAGRCAEETAAAEAATAALSGLIEGRPLTLSAVKGDKYFGRVVARVATADGDVAEALIADGHGRPYAGGKRRGWC